MIGLADLQIAIPQEEIADFCRRWKVTEFALFGSALRGDFRPDSDVDVLVSFAPDAHWSLFDLVKMQEELEAIFGRKVDLVKRAAVERSENYIRRKSILNNVEIVRRDDAHLLDILVAARKVLEFLEGVTWREFEQNDLHQHAAMYLLKVIGEAARRVSPQTRDAHPEIPWERMIGLRDHLTYEYFRVNLAAVWDAARNDLPRLIALIEPLVPPEEQA